MKPGNRKGRPNYPVEFKRRLAAAACEAGVSVSKLSLANGVNANMVFKWRREYLAGLFAGDGTEKSVLLPVVVVTSQDEPPAALPVPASRCKRGGIVIELGGAVVRIDATVDADTLRLVIASLRA